MAKIHTHTQAHEIIDTHTHEIMDHSTQAHCLAKVFNSLKIKYLNKVFNFGQQKWGVTIH
jgi:hypothetical protein